MLKTRIITAVVAGPAFVVAMFLLPSAGWSILVMALAAAGAWEWARLAGAGPRGCAALVLAFCSACLLALGTRRAGIDVSVALACASIAFWVLLAPAWLSGRWASPGRAMVAATAFIALVPFWAAMTELQRHPPVLLVLLGVVWIADSAAYFAGKAFGRRKLAPSISPGKTWEGVLGAVAGVTLYFALVSAIVPGVVERMAGAWTLPLFVAMTLLSIEGDLFESLLKRRAGVKDSGRLLPGHGGVLDRIDGWIPALPFATLVVTLVQSG